MKHPFSPTLACARLTGLPRGGCRGHAANATPAHHAQPRQPPQPRRAAATSTRNGICEAGVCCGIVPLINACLCPTPPPCLLGSASALPPPPPRARARRPTPRACRNLHPALVEPTVWLHSALGHTTTPCARPVAPSMFTAASGEAVWRVSREGGQARARLQTTPQAPVTCSQLALSDRHTDRSLSSKENMHDYITPENRHTNPKL